MAVVRVRDKTSKSKETLAKQEGVVRRASTLTAQCNRERRAAPFDDDSNDQDDPEEAAIKRINRARAPLRKIFFQGTSNTEERD